MSGCAVSQMEMELEVMRVGAPAALSPVARVYSVRGQGCHLVHIMCLLTTLLQVSESRTDVGIIATTCGSFYGWICTVSTAFIPES